MLRIALPNKGRLVDETRSLFDAAGLPLHTSDRALTASIGGEYLALFLRAQDIPEFVADGAADLGITGLDLVRESQRDVTSILDLGFGRCRLVVAVRDDLPYRVLGDIPSGARVATAFPAVAKAFFAARGMVVGIVPVSGAAEVAPHLGVADVIVDLTSTGSTLRVNGLREIDRVMDSTAHLIIGAAPALDPDRQRAVSDLQAALESVVNARGKRYLMANVPRAVLADVSAVLPGLNGPTVIDIHGARHVAVHAVVDAQLVFRTIASLKLLGAEGILVTRIERLMA